MNLPVVRGESGEYFLILNNGISLPIKKLKTVTPKTVKCERKASVTKTQSSLESFQIDISSQSASAVNGVSAVAPFVKQSLAVQNLPVKTMYGISENVRHCSSSAESGTAEKVKSYEMDIPMLPNISPQNSSVEDIVESFQISVPTQKSAPNVTVINISAQQSAPEVTVPTTTVRSLPVQDLSTLVFFDLESTGLPGRIAPKVQITELSMVAVSKSDFEKSQFPDLRDVRIMNKMSLCIRPTVGVSPRAAEITGLNDSNLLDHQVFDKDIASLIQIFISKLPKPVCLLAHNGNCFDFPLLKAELQSAGVQLNVDVLTADTLSAFRNIGRSSSSNVNMPVPTKRKKSEVKTERQSYALNKLYKKYFDKESANGHSAEGDCVALMMVCHKMKDSILPWICQNTRQFTSCKPMWS